MTTEAACPTVFMVPKKNQVQAPGPCSFAGGGGMALECVSSPNPKELSGAERRRWPRFEAPDVKAYLVVPPETGGWPVRVQDLSRGGARLVLEKRTAAGLCGTLVLARPERRASVKVEIQLAYVLAMPNDHFVLGGAFLRELTEAEMQALL